MIKALSFVKGDTHQSITWKLCTLSDGCLIQNAETTWGSSQRAFYTEKHCSSHLHIPTPLSPMPFCQLRTQHLSPLSRLQSSHFFKSLFGFLIQLCCCYSSTEKAHWVSIPALSPSSPHAWVNANAQVILLLLTRLATFLRLCRDPAWRKQALYHTSPLTK